MYEFIIAYSRWFATVFHGLAKRFCEMVTHWNPDENGKHTYLLPKADYREIRQIIDDLVDGK